MGLRKHFFISTKIPHIVGSLYLTYNYRVVVLLKINLNSSFGKNNITINVDFLRNNNIIIKRKPNIQRV